MLEKLKEKDIIIEVNLTSSVYIAHVENYDLHPIFRWFPISEKALDNEFNVQSYVNQVCVNTDDVGVMPTTFCIEYELVAKVTKKHSDDADMIEEWLSKLQKRGVTIFEDNQVKPYEKFDPKQFLHELYAL